VVCRTQSLAFTDNSTNSPTARTWTFTGGTPSTSNVFNPTVTYNTAGVYAVKLVVSNGIGSDSITQTNYITVNAGPNVSVDSSTILKCKYDDTVSFVGFGGLNYSWSPAAGISSSSNGMFNCFTQLPGTYIIKGFDVAGCFGIDTVVVSLKQPPFSLTIASIAGGFRVVSSNPPSTTTYQWFVNGAAIANSNNDTLFANGTGAYTCQVTISNGCKRTSTNTINFTGLNGLSNTVTLIDVLPNPNTGKFTLRIDGKESLGLVEITDVLGRKLSSQAIEGTQLSKTLTIGNAGVYFISVKNKAGKTIGIKKVMVE
jgi:PKD repeat protein